MIYVESLSSFFHLTYVPFFLALSGTWIIPVILSYDEIRKYFIRKN